MSVLLHGFIHDFSVRVGKMEPCPTRGVWGYAFQGASWAPEMLKNSYKPITEYVYQLEILEGGGGQYPSASPPV